MREIRLDATLLFGGDSAALTSEADTLLTPIAQDLARCPGNIRFDATGYTADPDCDNDPNDAATLAVDRATAVLARLRELGAPTATIGAANNGGHLIDNCP